MGIIFYKPESCCLFVYNTQDMKSALSRQLSRRRDLASQKRPLQEQQSNKETISKGRKEIVIEPSCSEVHMQN